MTQNTSRYGGMSPDAYVVALMDEWERLVPLALAASKFEKHIKTARLRGKADLPAVTFRCAKRHPLGCASAVLRRVVDESGGETFRIDPPMFSDRFGNRLGNPHPEDVFLVGVSDGNPFTPAPAEWSLDLTFPPCGQGHEYIGLAASWVALGRQYLEAVARGSESWPARG